MAMSKEMAIYAGLIDEVWKEYIKR